VDGMRTRTTFSSTLAEVRFPSVPSVTSRSWLANAVSTLSAVAGTLKTEIAPDLT